jgi:hypothetical protein
MKRLRDALTAITDRIGEALTVGMFPDDPADEKPRVSGLAPTPPPRNRSQRERRPPPMEYVMPRMGYRYHLSWTRPEGVLKRWWRMATRQLEADRTRASPDRPVIPI